MIESSTCYLLYYSKHNNELKKKMSFKYSLLHNQSTVLWIEVSKIHESNCLGRCNQQTNISF